MRQLISVVKKRNGRHERSIREFTLSEAGIRIGEPLRRFHGLLTGTPFSMKPAEPLTVQDGLAGE
ncbi:MAG: hypothetical protein NVV72_12730 [Asticcacaulis sp.]|nr:hypothetical protein [Asticcacaulis sp.]